MANSSQKKAKKGTPVPQGRPIRREVGGAVCWLLALCVMVSYAGETAVVVKGLRDFFAGLFGYGYYALALALLLAGYHLILHHGRPVVFRTVSMLLFPVFFGALLQVPRTMEYGSGLSLFSTLWKAGIELKSGGVAGGLLAWGLKSACGTVLAFVLIAVLAVLAFYFGMQTEIHRMWLRHQVQEKVPYEEEPEEPVVPAAAVRPAVRPRIDIPLDEEPRRAVQTEKKSVFTSFFRHRSEQQKTPAQVLNEQEAMPVTQAPPKPPAPTPMPILEDDGEPPAPPAASTAPPAPSMPPTAAPVPPATPAVPPAARKEKKGEGVAAETAAVTAEIEQNLAESEGEYRMPPLSLLHENRSENHIEAGAELRNNARRLSETLNSFGVDAKAGDVIRGPSVTRYEFTLDQGVKLSKVTNLADDIALALGASGVRIAPIPDKISVVGIEVPNKQVSQVLIRDVIASDAFQSHPSKVAFALGKDIGGQNIVGNIEKLPHVLIAGTTGSGKSVCTNSLIISLLYKSTPDQVRFIMVDPKMVELAPYNGIPHLLIPVVTDPKKAAGALQWAVYEMMRRYKTFSENNVKKLEEFNNLARRRDDLEPMPSVVVVIDELADLMLVAAKEVEESICRVAQMGRAAGVHLVIATQRPSADVITGLMKANIPSRIAFAVASSLESRIILDNSGAEKLVGKGDMLYAPLGEGKPTRVQGCYISPEEIEAVVGFVKQSGEANYSDEVISKIEEAVQEKEKGAPPAPSDHASGDEEDELLPAAVDVVLETGQASVSMLQRRLKLGYSRAARLVDQMEQKGIVGPFEGSKPRQLLITRARWQEMQLGGVEAEKPPFDPEEEEL